jgi:hypothetical protein
VSKQSSEQSWTLKTSFRLANPSALVVHRGFLYPKTFEAAFTRDDGLAVTISVEVDSVGGPTPMATTISSANGIRGDYRQPIPAMTRYAASQLAWTSDSPGQWTPAPAGTSVKMGRLPTRAPATSDLLPTVAALYREAITAGKPVTEYVRKGLSDLGQDRASSTVSRLIHEAREAKLLPKTRQGRKKG